ncbi:hypothetical protein TNCV_1246981 [Trichonephila clavipes]|uniref:Uncharacterized protein n=1 Tax=Trichonephila clavipes TaxID=2585209 RepID=A0A8X6RA74_TRICX|nr:hypothetical protein TNCV_1246981 [Trichonephila clavipes]
MKGRYGCEDIDKVVVGLWRSAITRGYWKGKIVNIEQNEEKKIGREKKREMMQVVAQGTGIQTLYIFEIDGTVKDFAIQTVSATMKDFKFTCRNCGGGDRGRVAIYRPFGEFRRAKSYCHLYGAQGQRQAYLLPMPR